MKARFDIQSATTGDNAYDLYLYGHIGEWPLTGNNILSELGKIEPSHLTIYIHSPGGSLFEGAAIYSQLERLKARGVPIDVAIDGLCASMASVIAMVGDTIRMHRNGMLMIHNPWMVADGDWEEMKNMSNLLLQTRDQLLDIYHERTGLPQKRIERMMKNETWMQPQEALTLGFIDGVIQVEKLETADSMAAVMNMAAADAFKKYQPSKEQPTTPDDMSLKAIVTKALGMSGDPSETEIENRLKAYAELEAKYKATAAKLEAIEKADKEAAEKKAVELVDQALADGKFLGEDREQWLEIAKNNYAFAQKQLADRPKTDKLAPKVNPASAKGKPSEDRSTWSIMDWSKNDPAGLERMQREQPEMYNRLEKDFIESAKGKYTT